MVLNARLWLRPLWRWYTSYPLLLAEGTLLVGVCWHFVLASFGIPDLFWHEDVLTQCFAGIGVGLLAADLGAAGALLSGGDPLFSPSGRGDIEGMSASESAFVRYLMATSFPLVAACAAGALRSPTDVAPWPLPSLAFATLASFTALTLWLGRRLGTARLRLAPEFVHKRIGAVDALHRPFHVLAYYYVLARVTLLASLWILYGVFDFPVFVAFSVCLFLGLLASGYGFLRFNFPGRVFGVLAAAFVVWAALNAFGGHRVEGLDYKARVPFDAIEERRAVDLLRSRDVLGAWASSRKGEKPPPLVVVAADGGGARAALWTLSVLQQLEMDFPSMPYHMRLISGASGGMLGAGAYVATLTEPGEASRHRDAGGAALAAQDLACSVAADGLAPVARQLFFSDFLIPPSLHPWRDRGWALERSWEKHLPALAQRFRSLAAGEAAGYLPSLVLAPFVVEDGRRVLISNIDLSELAAVGVPATPPSTTRQAVQLFPAFGAETLRLSTALRLNATFPYVTPAAELPTVPGRRLMDAGYYDEHGVELAAEWLWSERDWIGAHAGGVALIQIPDTRAQSLKESMRGGRRPWWVRGLTSILGPVEAVFTSREGTMAFRNDALLRNLAETFNRGADAEFFQTFVFEPSAGARTPTWGGSWLRRVPSETPAAEQDVALSWRLTRSEIAGLARGMASARNCGRRAALASWWASHGGQATGVSCAPTPDLVCPEVR